MEQNEKEIAECNDSDNWRLDMAVRMGEQMW